VFAWHSRSGAFDRLNPPWRPVSVVAADGGITDGCRVRLRIPVLGPLSIPWELEHREYREGVQFVDQQVTGPFAQWRHQHTVTPQGDGHATLTDSLSYQLPAILAAGAPLIHPLLVRELTRLFRYRHAVLAADLTLHSRFREHPRQRILVSGSSGLVGSALCSFLSTAGHTVYRLVRRAPRTPLERFWDPARELLDPAVFEGIDAVVHLGGTGIAERRWSSAQKDLIRATRVQPTALLSRTLAGLTEHAPRVALFASAVGFYGETGAHTVTEASPCGSGFLPEVCAAWESASQPVEATSIRRVLLRIATVLSPRGGALARMLPPFQAGVGGRLGSGLQSMSWIALTDLLGIIEHAICCDQVQGALNCCAPQAVTNAEFTATLGRVLRRPTVLPVPASALRLLFGELADALLLGSSCVAPAALQRQGYQFLFPDLEAALRFECGRP
jgi:uncharacterized protein (TIGR01777 family)